MERKAGRRRRILFYNHTGLVSGAEHVLLNTLAGLDRSRFEPVVLCPADGDLRKRVEGCGIEVLEADVLQARFASNPFMVLRYLVSFGRVIKRFRASVLGLVPDAIQANSVRAGLVAVGATVGTGIPVIWHVHDDLPKHPISSLIRLVAFLSKRSVFLAVSASTARVFCGRLMFGSRMHTLHNGIDLERFPEKLELDKSFRDDLGITDHEFLICAVGMVNPRKDLLGLVEALRVVHEQRPEARLAIVGRAIFNRDDLYFDQVRRLTEQLGLSNVVRFTGARSDVAAVLRGADLLVLNAKVEPFGLVLVEAMASGTPVLATRVGGIPEIVTHGVTGFLVGSGRPDVLAAKMLEIMDDPEGARRIARTARDRVASHFSLATYYAGYDALLKAVVDRGSVGGGPRVALFHDNFAQSGGAEGVAEALHQTLQAAYPNIDLLSTLSAKERLSAYLREVPMRTTWMQRLPAKAKLFRAYFLLYPFAVDRVDLREYDLVVTSCFGYAKGVRRHAGAVHVCYCHTPMRWVWRTEDYLSRERNGRLKRLALALPLRWLKHWELQAASRPDLYLANSKVVADRLFRAFGVPSTVIPPPIDTKRFAPKGGLQIEVGDFYLVLARLVPYKRLDLAVQACSRTHRKLVVIGDGPDRGRLEAMAGMTITFLGRASNEVVIEHAQLCRALLFPGEEDFGMTPLEINAAGRPVVAYRGGGAMETVVDGVNGVFFDDATVDSMIEAIDRMEATPWDSGAIQRHARQFDREVFASKILKFVEDALADKRARAAMAAEAVTA